MARAAARRHRSDTDSRLGALDQAARLLLQRAAGLTDGELDWQPPDGGWPLRRVLHHVARSELLHSASLDEALPAADSQIRYVEAGRRLDESLRMAVAQAEKTSIVYAGLYGILCTPEDVINSVLVMEGELLAGAA